MEYYTLDENLRRKEVIENYQSIIWTERYSAFGDFQIVTKSTAFSRRQLAEDTWITRQGSTYVAIVDTVTSAEDSNGVVNLTVVGRMLEALFDDRVAMPGLTDTTTVPSWVLTGTPGAIAREMFNQVCVSTIFDVHDSIPFYNFGTLLPTGDLLEPTQIITLTAPPDTLYNTLKKLCDTYILGFRLVKEGETGRIYFEVYTGNDLTTNQTDRDPVVFDPNMDNLSQPSYISSTVGLKTVAYVFASNGSAVVYSPVGDPNGYGTDRRVLLVNSSNSDAAGPDLDTALHQEGVMALAAQTRTYAFDGTLPPNSPYIYGVHYGLGDLVEERNSSYEGNQMVVTEQIFSSDDTGDKSYPTLTLKNVITPGSWIAWPGADYWDEVPDTVHWADLS
jgi:hypothetical protein